MAINKQTRDKLIAKAQSEIQFARQFKQGIIWRWHRTENLYYANKDNRFDPSETYNRQLTPESRANVNIAAAKMFGFVETYLSKIDTPLTFKFSKPTMADYKRAKLLNALKEQDSNNGDWDFKDLLGKVNAILYGRAIFSYYADSEKGYYSHLDCIDPYDFLIDPSAGGYDLDNAMYLGRYNVRKSKYELKEGRKSGDYIRSEVDKLIQGSGNDANQTSQEDVNKQNKYSYIGSPGNRTIQDPDMYKFWEWYTTLDGERYYLLLEESAGACIRCEKLKDMFKEDGRIGDAMYPFWTFAFVPNATEFWVPPKTDYVREVFMAQGVSINQMLDNAEQINKPQRAVDVTTIENVADLVYRRNGIIRMKGGVDVNKAFKMIETNSISTPITVYNTLDTIQQVESGITAAAMGVAAEDKVGIYEGNQANTADRYGVANKSYSQGYKRFAILWKNGIEDHLTLKTAVKILGPQGMEQTVFVTKRDVKPSADWNIIIESNNAEAQADMMDKRNKIQFMAAYKGDPTINQKELFETGADIVGFTSEKIRSFLDTSEYGNADMISEAERDIEDLLNHKIIEPNYNADSAYMSHILRYIKDHKEDMKDDTFTLMMDYLNRVEPIAIQNMGSNLMNKTAKMGMMPEGTSTAGSNDLSQIQPEVMGQTAEELSHNAPTQV